MDVEVTQVKKRFNINEGVNLPANISKRVIGNTYLFLAPDKASLITTNEFGNRFVEMFKNQKTIKEVIDLLHLEGIPMDTISPELHEFMVKLEKKGFYEDRAVLKVYHEPNLHLDITNTCNLSCIHCFRDAGKRRENELVTADWLRIIDAFASIFKTHVTISGGEPLLYPGFMDIVKRARGKGLTITVFTNGTLLNKVIIESLAENVEKIQVSLDGASEEVNDKIRGSGSFKKVIDAVHLLSETNIIIDVAFSVMPENLDDFYQNIECLVDVMGTRVNYSFSEVLRQGRGNSSHQFKKDNKGSGEAYKLKNHLIEMRLKAPGKDMKNVKLNNCGYGEIITISSEGDIYPCAIYEPKIKYGNARIDDLAAIFKKINEDKNKVSLENMAECRNCDLRNICCGGCRINNLLQNGDMLKPECLGKENFKDEMYRLIVEKEKKDPLDLWLGKAGLKDKTSKKEE